MQYSLIVQKLQEYRKKCNILQIDMAEYLDITQSEYSKIELGKTKISYNVLDKLYKRGCDIDMLVIGKETDAILPSFEKIYIESDLSKFIGWLKLCEWALQHWVNENQEESQMGRKLLKIFVNEEHNLTALEKLRLAYGGITQQEMADIIGVNIKKYRRLEKGEIYPDAELLSTIYEVTKCRPSYFLDENNFYLSLISEECRYGQNREEFIKGLITVEEQVKENE